MSQTVAYSSQIVTKISDITRTMGVSSSSSIKHGSIAVSGNASSIDESKFVESDLNIIVSVKVVNRKHRYCSLNSSESYTWGKKRPDGMNPRFIEGGDLHGVISIKILDSSKKEEVKAKIIGDINSSSPGAYGFNPSGINDSALSRNMSETETTISVNWSGGGNIKEDEEEWSLDSLYRVAAAFPAKVAACPHKTWAVLSRYDNNESFVTWAIEKNIKLYDHSGADSYASDLLDTYMGYKNNIRRIQDVLVNPIPYTLGPSTDPISIIVDDLIQARNEMRLVMASIIKEVDDLNADINFNATKKRAEIKPPELWAIRLPIRSDLAQESREALEKFALLDSDLAARRQVATGDSVTDLSQWQTGTIGLTDEEGEVLKNLIKYEALKGYQFNAISCAGRAETNWDSLKEDIKMNVIFSNKFNLPKRIEVGFDTKDDLPVLNFNCIFGEGSTIASPHAPGSSVQTLDIDIKDRITKVQIGKSSSRVDGKEVISSISLKTNGGRSLLAPPEAGATMGDDRKEFPAPAGKGLAFIIPIAKYGERGAIGRLLLAWK
ncbi:hypothetical protein CTheo_6242 [Ceratobasidium theobromae]|uniref:Uncharacterized protein n=1 Tax=Ceratobasidium theobromae TaxID=1582974 RepID=A0A5N5QF67_9AGAM|nr:hypothetical protein CTheo_6242 [Ceratobasidium theobromae]